MDDPDLYREIGTNRKKKQINDLRTKAQMQLVNSEE